MLRFECDYGEGAAPAVLDLLQQTNFDQTPGYGEDEYCAKAAAQIRSLCDAPDADVHFFVGATQANLTVIAAALKPWQGVLCADSGHIHVHETGAVEATGHKCLALPGKNGKITARVRVTRGVSEDIFREKIEPMGSYDDSFQNVTDIQLFVSYSSTVGYRARDERWSNKIEYSGSEFESLLGEPVTIKSLGTIPSGRKVFIRAAARINYDTPKGSGTRRWNYSAPVEVMIP